LVEVNELCFNLLHSILIDSFVARMNVLDWLEPKKDRTYGLGEYVTII